MYLPTKNPNKWLAICSNMPKVSNWRWRESNLRSEHFPNLSDFAKIYLIRLAVALYSRFRGPELDSNPRFPSLQRSQYGDRGNRSPGQNIFHIYKISRRIWLIVFAVTLCSWFQRTEFDSCESNKFFIKSKKSTEWYDWNNKG